jgi:2-methylisocitrate lyase-like PEP mutase family enzyme
MTSASSMLFRDKLSERQAMLVPGAANALAARVIEELGFQAVYVSGAGIANTLLGVPDIGLVTLTEVVNTVSSMRDAVGLPLVVDADTGFGNAIAVIRTVKTLERAGADAIQLEDQAFPKKCGHFRGKKVIDAAEMEQKVKAAVDARTNEQTLIIARTDARAIEGFDRAIERAARYAAAGADLTFVEAPVSCEELCLIPSRLSETPQVYNAVVGGATPILPQQELAKMGFAMALYANASLQAAIFGMTRVLSGLLRDGSLDAVGDWITDFEERQQLVRKPLYDELELKYAVLMEKRSDDASVGQHNQ